jgi:hypothetical protein
LFGGGIANADWRRAFITAEPVDHPLGNAMLSGQSVHDLQPFRLSGGGAQHPFTQSPRILVEGGIHQREQREGSVAQAAIAVIPRLPPRRCDSDVGGAATIAPEGR